MAKRKADQVYAKVVVRLKELRKSQGISHEKLAAMAGVTRSAISFTESGKTNPTFYLCLKIAEALGVSLGDLIKEVEE